MTQEYKNPADQAAEKALKEMYRCLDLRKSFLEAGAGAGKTQSLIEALKYLIEKQGENLLRKNQQIACITFTNVACDEIKGRVGGHPAVFTSTIHAFCWILIKDYQKNLWQELIKLPYWGEKLKGIKGESNNRRKVVYDLGHRQVDDDKVLLGHNDVISLTVMLMENVKFKNIFISRFPILLIDEYQDTNAQFADSILTHLVNSKDSNCIVGFFGDGWQKIYGDGCGSIRDANLIYINKHANFRSEKAIVDVLNRLRPELKQAIKDPQSTGYVKVFHTNDWSGERLSGPHWNGDLPPRIAHDRLEFTINYLKNEGWDFNPEKTKILMLTHNVLAKEQGYGGIANVFRGRNDDFVKQEDSYINFFVNTLEPICSTYENKQYGNMFELLDRTTPTIHTLNDKVKWKEDMETLLRLRSSGTIGEVLDHLKKTKRPRLSSAVEEKEQEFENYISNNGNNQDPSMERIRNLKTIPYQEVVALTRFIENRTPFSTKHGVKGAEFENVLVVIGRGWNKYDFNQFLEYSADIESIPRNKLEFYEDNRNLFYVAVSRPTKRLAILFTQELSDEALTTIYKWFGKENVCSIEILFNQSRA
jgi:DNA helicase-2/ATP-dependent DNA helicase PcrA